MLLSVDSVVLAFAVAVDDRHPVDAFPDLVGYLCYDRFGVVRYARSSAVQVFNHQNLLSVLAVDVVC